MENRFDGIFKVAYDMEGVPEDCLVPKLFLQPLVENAIIHGFESGEPGEQGGLVKISGRLAEDRLVFEVSDNGKGMSPQQGADARSTESTGIGMRNVISRLALLYGE
ncbi:ATP-binding protein [Paenibacillus sp. FSL H8-0537]|uniref:sensor histidine kinase n=1 Tax=Paenibacillus sp. FSL H8-0537 TaxID=2921399 RepID=UPI003100C2F9